MDKTPGNRAGRHAHRNRRFPGFGEIGVCRRRRRSQQIHDRNHPCDPDRPPITAPIFEATMLRPFHALFLPESFTPYHTSPKGVTESHEHKSRVRGLLALQYFLELFSLLLENLLRGFAVVREGKSSEIG